MSSSRDDAPRFNAVSMVNWSRYLESLCTTYAQWWQVYTITDVVGRKRVESEPSPLFDFGLMVQTVERDREERGKGEEKVERFSVLEGLRKYASEHVLLVERPGSGKSTALVRLVLEEAKANLTPQPPHQGSGSLQGKGEQETRAILEKGGEHFSPLLAGEGQGERSTKVQGNQPKIPVLVELRYYRTSILDLIQDFLQRHDPNLSVDAETLKTWLRQGQLLLLVDGLNELPSEEARRDLHKFRQDYQKTTPMIFTTRDLGVGGDLDIAKKLEMQTLSEAQMQQFVRAYLPEQGEQMLRQLGSRLREFGQTPLLLWMLCSVFRAMGKVPPNLGLVFRQFAASYDRKLKQDIPISKESRRWWHRLLEQLAWVMTSGEAKTEIQVAISRQQAETVLAEFLAAKVAHPEDCALCCLDDLLKHHLIQLGAGDQIEFRHQLIQEYYTAESLLKRLPSLSDDELKREYLNYLKWTEPLALMLELVEDEAQAVRVVKLALEVDLRLGARLAGAVKPEWHKQTVELVTELEIPRPLQIQLLGVTRSKQSISTLLQVLEDEASDVCKIAIEVLEDMTSETTIAAPYPDLKQKKYEIYRSAATANEIAIPNLIQELSHETAALNSLVPLLKPLVHEDTAVQKVAVSALIQALEYQSSQVHWIAAPALGKVGSPELLPRLHELLLAAKQTDVLNNVFNAISEIQKRCKFYNYTLTQPIPITKPQPNILPIEPISTSLMHILHLSDLHFDTLDQANLWSNQLAADLYNDLSIPHLDALILSGDIANYSTQEEYKAAQQFLHNLRQDFPLNPEQIILVPGNHDLNWKLAKKAYQLIDRDDHDGELIDGHYIEESASVIRVRDEAEYKQRFAHFSQFYETIKQTPYPLDYDQQYTLDHLKEQNLLILGLNSAWQLDHHYKTRASINTNALSNALTQIRRNPDYKNCLKIAVWHHPLDSPYSDRITDQGFLEQLAVNGFRFFLHGHIHKAETSLFRYDMSTNGRKLDRICAGTFGAPVREWVPGYPLQYNLLKFEDNQLTVYTRRREELNGAWKPDARWLQGAGKAPLDYYAITL